ncbi:MAG: serine/threonine-protein kinase [Myxococcota bacterium]
MRGPEPSLSTPVRPPRLNGRYVVSRLIGKGAQARVYLAYDARLKQWRACKVLAPNCLDDEHVRARFEQEAQAMARLSHPNLLRVVDVDHDGRTPFMVMELARGGAVTDWMKRNGPIPAILACRIAQQCCSGLSHAHALGVVHRDVKPHNMLVREDGTVALTDFGIAQVRESASLTTTGTIMGTFAFMAPEQRTDAKSVDQRADVYSLGASLFTMLTGKTSAELFFAESRDAILRGVPEPLRPVILTACRYEREQRYPSMGELAEAIERRIERLAVDPPVEPLVSHLLPIPTGLPEWVEPDANVDELVRALDASEEQPTFVPSTPQPADPTRTELGGGALPYRMPASSSSTSRRWAEAGRPDDVPGYVDTNTVERAPNRSTRAFEIDDTGARSIHDQPSGASRDPLYLVAVLLTSAVALLFAVLLAGIAGKVYTSHRVDVTGEALIHTVTEERQVIADLVGAGGDEAGLQDRWYQFQDADQDHKVELAAMFAQAVEDEAARVNAAGLTLSHVSVLTRARREWQSARSQQDAVTRSVVARLTGPIGVF